MKDPYKVLGVSPSATDEEIKTAYRSLARRYHPDNYPNDSAAAREAGERMKELNAAYDAITEMRARTSRAGAGADYVWIRERIRAEQFAEAELTLEQIPVAARTAEWHYLKSVLLARRGWQNDAIREVEIACTMDPQNREYAEARQFYRQRAGSFGGGYTAPRRAYEGQMGGCRVCDCDTCSTLICADCCCECMGFDLIRCI